MKIQRKLYVFIILIALLGLTPVLNPAQAIQAATAPLVITQPSNQVVLVGVTSSFSATASGDPAPTIQWQSWSTESGAYWEDIPGATSPTLSFTAELSQDGYQYQAVFSNASGSTTSNPAMLRVAETGSCIVTNGHYSSVYPDTLNYWLLAIGEGGLPACSTITFAGNMIVQGPVLIVQDATIDGGEYKVTISGDRNNDGLGDINLIEVKDTTGSPASNPTAILKNLTLQKGWPEDNSFVAPIRNFGSLTLNQVDVVDSSGYGAIWNVGTLNLIDSSFTRTQTSPSSAIWNNGNLNVTRTSFSNNAGTILNLQFNINYPAGVVTITDSMFAGNAAYNSTYWVMANQGTMTISGSTFNGNSAGDYGIIWNAGNLNLVNNTFANNSTTVGATIIDEAAAGHTISMYNNILVDGATGLNCALGMEATFSAGSNLADDGSCGAIGFTQKTATEINLGTLSDNGGPTLTIPLLAGSVAIDAGDDSVCPATDQRGVSRPQGAACDVGAYEVEPQVTTYSISGGVFYDDNFNGVMDGEEYHRFGVQVYLDQGCNGTMDSEYLITYPATTYSFTNLMAGERYCVRYGMPGYEQSTDPLATEALNADISGFDVGFTYFQMDFDRVDLNGPVGVPYTRTVAITHAVMPVDFTGTEWVTQPAGLVFTTDANAGTLTISGTPTAVGEGQITLQVTDAAGRTMLQTLLFWIQTDANAAFTSSQSPSEEGQEVTFSLEFVPDFPFAGSVIFYDGDTVICEGQYLAEMNDYYGQTIDYNPASCSTSTLTVGTHPIRAEYTSMFGGYLSNMYTLEQVVQVLAPAPALTVISPASATAGASDLTLTVTGSGFVSASKVRWNGVDLATTFVSDNQLSANIPANHLATVQTAQVNVFTPAPGEAASNVLAFFVTEAAAGVTAQDAFSGLDPSASVTLATAAATGDGLLAIAQYDANPGGTPSFSASGTYFDVYAAPGNTFTEVSITACDLNGGDKLFWWDTEMRKWLKANPQTFDQATGCITLVITDSSSPTLTQLQGTFFAAGVEINSAPTAYPGGPYLGAINTTIAFDGSLSADADGDALTYAWEFGDGSTGTGAAPAHSYAAPGVYNVCLTVRDGALDSAPACTLVVVYDPSGGFVTGGGWIDSQPGAYKLDATLSGKATFGFVSRYLKGATVPSGNTEFQFQAGSFKFHSTSYDWLVVSKDKVTAQFKGAGMVNGSLAPNGSAYRFMLWAGDSTPDTFRIRIWWEDAAGVETVVYDNGFNQAIGNGSIVVHTGK